MEAEEMIDLIKAAWGWSRTVFIGTLIAAPLALLQILEAAQIVDPREVFPEPWGSRAALAVSVLMIVLRLITTSAVGEKDGE
jgi:hypothetical protein